MTFEYQDRVKIISDEHYVHPQAKSYVKCTGWVMKRLEERGSVSYMVRLNIDGNMVDVQVYPEGIVGLNATISPPIVDMTVAELESLIDERIKKATTIVAEAAVVPEKKPRGRRKVS